MTRTQFTIQVAVEVAHMKAASAEVALPVAATIMSEFLEQERIEFGDPKYDWTEAGAKTLAKEYASY
jgi:hypothetical protein